MKQSLLSIILMLLVVECKGQQTDSSSSSSPSGKTQFAAIDTSPASGSIISNNQIISVKYTKNIDLSSVRLTGSMSAEVTKSLSQPDTLVLTPGSYFTAGSRNITIAIQDTSGNPADSLTISYNVKTSVYVRPTGSNSNSGVDPNSPKQTIQNAIDYCNANFANCDVRIGQGDYSAEGLLTQKTGVSLWGSYSASGWTASSVNSTPSVVQNLTVQDTVSVGTITDGVSISGTVSPFYGSVTLQNSKICQIQLYAGSPVITGNTFSCANGQIFLATANAVTYPSLIVRIERNIFNTSATVIKAENTATSKLVSVTARNNLLISTTSGYGFDGITMTLENLTMENNTIIGNGACVLYETVSKPLRIVNNIMSGSGVAIAKMNYMDANSVISNNDLYLTGGTTTYFQSNGAGGNGANNTISAMEAHIATLGSTAQNNTNANPSFVSPGTSDYRIQFLSPVKSIGQDLSSIFSVDLQGLTRTAPWSVGAYERD